MPAQPLRVALLGCGVVGTEVARLLPTQRRRPRRPRRRAARARRHRGPRAEPPPRPRRRPGAAHHGRRGLVDGRRRRRRGDRRHRAGPRRCILRAMEHGAVAWSPRTRRCSPRTARRCTRPPTKHGRRPLLRGRGRRRDPAACARCASRSPATASRRVLGIVNGTTNYVLDQMDTTGAGFDEAVAAGAGARVRRGRPHGRRRGLRRRGQGRDPRLARVPHPRRRGRRAPRGHHRRHRRRRRRRPRHPDCVVKLLAIAERTERRRDEASRCACTRRCCRASTRWRRARRVQRGVRRGRGRRRADVLRPRAPAASRRPARCSATSSRWPAHRVARRPRPGRVHLRRPARAADGRGADPLPRAPGRRRPAGRARPGRAASSPTTACRSRRSASAGCRRRPRRPDAERGPRRVAARPSSSSRTPRRTPRWPRRSTPLAELDIVDAVASRAARRGQPDGAPVARRDRGVRATGCRARAGRRGRHAGRGRHAAGARARTCPS